MKLAAIYNLWDGEEFLIASMKSVAAGVDVFVIVWQNTSNFGEKYNPLDHINFNPNDFNKGTEFVWVQYTPLTLGGFKNEIAKRNLGIEEARKKSCTHFLHMDADEFYKDFIVAKKLFVESGADGSVCPLYTYFKLPTLRFETEDGYFVPFIHKLKPETHAGSKEYPFYVDPTRKINTEKVVKIPVHMHHFSWIRLDINRKVRNSSAKSNLERGSMLISYNNPECKEGFYVPDYDKKLINVDDYFNLLHIFVHKNN